MSNDKTPEERLRDSLTEYIAAKASGRKFHVEVLYLSGWASVNPTWSIDYDYRIVYEPRTIWVNEYSDVGLGYAYDSREKAQQHAKGNPNCVRTVKFVEDYDAD